jgi:hypothetical protein
VNSLKAGLQNDGDDDKTVGRLIGFLKYLVQEFEQHDGTQK